MYNFKSDSNTETPVLNVLSTDRCHSPITADVNDLTKSGVTGAIACRQVHYTEKLIARWPPVL